MLGYLANTIQTLLASYDFAIFTHWFYGCLYLHN